MSANNPPSFRLPFTLGEDVHPEVKQGIRYLFNGLLDASQAIAALAPKVNANTAAVQTPAKTPVLASAGTSIPNGLGAVNNQSGNTSYTTQQFDFGALILLDTASAFALTLNSSLTAPYYCVVENLGTGTATLTPSAGTVNGAGSVPLYANQSGLTFFDGSNWWMTTLPASAVINFADDETPSGTINGVNKVFTLAHSPNPASSLMLYNNGLLQDSGGGDCTLTGSTVTFVVAPPALSTLTAFYRY